MDAITLRPRSEMCAGRSTGTTMPGSTRRVMISGADLEPAVVEQARQAGFDDCLDKLLDFSALKKLLGH